MQAQPKWRPALTYSPLKAKSDLSTVGQACQLIQTQGIRKRSLKWEEVVRLQAQTTVVAQRTYKSSWEWDLSIKERSTRTRSWMPGRSKIVQFTLTKIPKVLQMELNHWTSSHQLTRLWQLAVSQEPTLSVSTLIIILITLLLYMFR